MLSHYVVLAISVVSVQASATIQSLVTISRKVRKITIIPAGAIYMAHNGAASAASSPLSANVGYELGVTPITDLRLFAALATNVTIVQEG